ncbi:MAG: hypothetical protein WAL74_18145, partial [Candidatus Acidiferrales bacterium]
MNRKVVVSLLVVVNGAVALSLMQSQPRLRAAQPGHVGATTLLVDGTQPPAPPPGRSAATLLADGTQP